MSFFESYQQTVFFVFDPCTSPGPTCSADVYTVNYLSTRNYTFFVKVENIDSKVVVRLEGSLDGCEYAPMLSEEITADGNYAYNSYGFPMKKIRCNFFSETGGNKAIVTFKVAAN